MFCIAALVHALTSYVLPMLAHKPSYDEVEKWWHNMRCLEDTDRLAHRRLNVERLDVLPVLLEQRDEEVDA